MLSGPLLVSDVFTQLSRRNARADIQAGLLGPGLLVGHVPADEKQAWPAVTPLAIFTNNRALGEAGLAMDMFCWPLRPRRLVGVLQSHLRLGRASNNDLVVAHTSVSRLHAHIMTRNQDVTLMDCGSTQGTWVNELRLAREEPMPLRDRDRVVVGEVELRFVRALTLLDLLTRQSGPSPQT